MPDKDLIQGSSLAPTDRTRYTEIDTDVYAETVALGGPNGSFTQDRVTGALTTIDYPHHEIHEGSTFLASFKSADGAPIADNATISFTSLLPTMLPYRLPSRRGRVTVIWCSGQPAAAIWKPSFWKVLQSRRAQARQ
jgi:hypothetical protein